jgi:hypothetical protein
MRVTLALLLTLCLTAPALGYGYTRAEDPLIKAYQAAIRAARADEYAKAKALIGKVGWQLDELREAKDLKVDFRRAFAASHEKPTRVKVVGAWVNLMYLGLLQKLHWNRREKLSNFHRARARLDAAWAYYELALAGNVKRQDAARRKRDPKAPSRHADLVTTFAKAKKALGSPGLFGAGKRAPDPKAFSRAALRIAGHLAAVFPGFVRPGQKNQKNQKKE